MAPINKRARAVVEDDDGDASSSRPRDSSRKKVRLSNDSRPAREESDSSSSEDDPEETNGYSTAPAATQYEDFRDQGFRHLANPDQDDQRATQKLQRKIAERSELIGDNHAAENAIIEEVTCVNFMCHDRLNVKLGPLINFVVGMNGSGKSAVLTAITLCLGGKTSSTNRGTKVKDMIKSGQEHAALIVVLKNQGNDAYQPEIFGKSIIVERHFSTSGSSSWKLKNEFGKLIYKTKGDVDDMVEYYQLQVDNPMNVLSQDAAKTFINKSNPQQKYKFFVEGVQLEALDNDYKMVSDSCDQIAEKLDETKDNLDDLKKTFEIAMEKSNIAKQSEGLRSRLRKVRQQTAWAQVEQVERALAEREAALHDAQNAVVQQEATAEEKGKTFDALDEKLEVLKQREQKAREEEGPIRGEAEMAKEAHDKVKGALEKLRADRQSIKTNMAENDRKVKSIQNDIDKEVQLLEAANGGAQSVKQAEIAETEQSLSIAEESQKRLEADIPRLQQDVTEAQTDADKAARAVTDKRSEFESANARLRNLGQGQVHPLSGFDPKLQNLVKMINAERGFREKPVGPIGTHIKIRDPFWSQIVEAVLGNALNGFIVTSKADQQLLIILKRRANVDQHWIPVIIGNHQTIDTAAHEPDPKYLTVLRAMEIDNELVKNHLIISSMIEQSLLAKTRTEGFKIMFEGPERPLRHAKQCFAPHDTRRDFGHRFGYSGLNKNPDMGPLNIKTNSKSRTRTDIDRQIAHQQDTVAQLDREANSLENQRGQAAATLQKCKQALERNSRDRKAGKVKIQKIQDKIEDLKTQLEQYNVQDGRLDGLREELTEREREQSQDKTTYGDIGLEMQKCNEEALEKKRKLDEVKLRLQDHEALMDKILKRRSNFEQSREMALREKNHHITLIQERKDQLDRCERKRTEAYDHVQDFISQASQICGRVVVPPGETSETLETKYEALRRQLAAREKNQGGTDEEIHQRALAASQNLENARAGRDELEDLLNVLRRSFALRMVMFRRFQRFISARSRINFNYLLSERAFRGKLTIDHKARLLDVHVEPDETTKSGKGRETKTLSGGEKSFSSICLLLALWEAMGAPLRCLDEYDVFMDDVNRDVSTRMIISAARRSVGRQFILITPKGLGEGAGNGDEDVKIIKLLDPRKKQQQIDEMLPRA
ncbi:hypothetical protein HYFRA_00009609 [Hymenoscyphus fraxineus]|uniref:RecF/RecN/SMC N-terminal domain-containing protein n=1 Tax=Hymenoscyphus fraxineus TaxID=746836 RepID=A0A9N9PMM1_9HELO|nr:hypothetical protein HYFRA_00009609 [Hymenoscyphus fraxineus]